MSTRIELESQLTELLKAQSAMFDEADAKHGGTEPPELKDQIIAKGKEIEEVEKRLKDRMEMDAARKGTSDRLDHFTKPVNGPVFPGNGSPSKGQEIKSAKSLGAMFTESEEWQTFFKDNAKSGQFSEKQHVQSPPMQIPVSLKTLITGVSDSSAGGFIIADQSGIYDPLGRRELTIRDLVSVRTTMSDLIEYVVQATRTNAAAAVAEATASGGSSGVKPEGGMTFTRVQTTVKTLAEWVAATKRSLSDAGQMRGIIDDELRMDLEQLIDDQIINGDGVGENLLGLDAVSGTQDQAWSVSILETTRKARTLVKTVGRANPTAYALNPTDWQTIDLAQDNEARYYFGGPSIMGTPRLWGLPVVESEAVPVGWGWVGDWKRIVLWDREQFAISVSDSHSDFFIRNLVAILGEARVALGVIRPSAFVEMDLTA